MLNSIPCGDYDADYFGEIYHGSLFDWNAHIHVSQMAKGLPWS